MLDKHYQLIILSSLVVWINFSIFINFLHFFPLVLWIKFSACNNMKKVVIFFKSLQNYQLNWMKRFNFMVPVVQNIYHSILLLFQTWLTFGSFIRIGEKRYITITTMYYVLCTMWIHVLIYFWQQNIIIIFLFNMLTTR